MLLIDIIPPLRPPRASLILLLQANMLTDGKNRTYFFTLNLVSICVSNANPHHLENHVIDVIPPLCAENDFLYSRTSC